MKSRYLNSFETVLMVVVIIFSICFISTAYAQQPDCLKCHGRLDKEKVVHAAMGMGCSSCHTTIDASKIPHKKTNNIAKGLSSEQPDLCYGCHDKGKFSKKTVHAAVGMGCTGCHNPHSSKNEKLLTSGMPGICLSCHDKAEFGKKTVHAPVAGGMCMSCHSPHSSDEIALLNKKPIEVCIECHPDVTKKPHAVAGISSGRHPLGEPKKIRKKENNKWVETQMAAPDDPARPGKPFYCGSCHNPHSSDGPKLFRHNARSAMDICMNCHKM